MLDKKDLELHVFSKQMFLRGVLDEDEQEERFAIIADIESDPTFHDDNFTKWREAISKSVVKRRNAAAYLAIEMVLPHDVRKLFERYLYDCLEKSELPQIEVVNMFLSNNYKSEENDND